MKCMAWPDAKLTAAMESSHPRFDSRHVHIDVMLSRDSTAPPTLLCLGVKWLASPHLVAPDTRLCRVGPHIRNDYDGPPNLQQTLALERRVEWGPHPYVV